MIIRLRPDVLSEVPGHEGPAICVWKNPSQLDHRLDNGVSGAFRAAKRIGPFWITIGPEFHGLVPVSPGHVGKVVTSIADPVGHWSEE